MLVGMHAAMQLKEGGWQQLNKVAQASQPDSFLFFAFCLHCIWRIGTVRVRGWYHLCNHQ
jgi:hypothetical protein